MNEYLKLRLEFTAANSQKKSPDRYADQGLIRLTGRHNTFQIIDRKVTSGAPPKIRAGNARLVGCRRHKNDSVGIA
jgi:hypothetical protein